MLQKSLGYAIEKIWRFYRVTEKIVIFKKIENYKIWAMNLSSDCFVKFYFDPILRLSDKIAKIAKENGFLPYCQVKYMACL